MFHFKQGLGWKACYDDENNIYTAKTSWRGTFDLYEINAEIYHQLGEPDVNSDELIHSGRHLYSLCNRANICFLHVLKVL